MKTAVAFVAVCFACVAAGFRDSPMHKAMVGGYEECKNTLSPTKETLELVETGEGTNDEKANEMRICVIKKMGLFEDGTFNTDRLRELLNSGEHAHPERTDRIIADIEKCQGTADASGDEKAMIGNLAKCLRDMRPHGRPHHRPDEE